VFVARCGSAGLRRRIFETRNHPAGVAGTARAPQAGECRNIETPARVIFYQSNQGYTGPDQVVVELKKANGSTETQSVAITVEPAKRLAPQKPATTEL